MALPLIRRMAPCVQAVSHIPQHIHLSAKILTDMDITSIKKLHDVNDKMIRCSIVKVNNLRK